MKTIILFGILLFNIFFETVISAQMVPYGIALDESKTIFLDKTEMPVIEWYFYYNLTKDSVGYPSVLPDTAMFRQLYGYSFLISKGMSKNEVDNMFTKHKKFPMSCITYEQAMQFCKWRTKQLKSNKLRIEYTLPTVNDYEKALKKASITSNLPISTLNKKIAQFTGITDNVAEFTLNEKLILNGGNSENLEFSESSPLPIGIRCKAILIEY
jgi:formylglycine-generating enzyme required for sulfatase activity